jgi:hypothetical protein
MTLSVAKDYLDGISAAIYLRRTCKSRSWMDT